MTTRPVSPVVAAFNARKAEEKRRNGLGVFGDGWDLQSAIREGTQWIADNNGAMFSVCSNTMLSRGLVFHVTLTDGMAIICSTQDWWAMSYSEHNASRAGETLGRVVCQQISGCLKARLAVVCDNGATYGLGQG